jgi:hypothetical protein
MKKLLPHIKNRLENSKVKYLINEFHSGAIMVDIWINDKFFVIQIDGDTIGLCEVTEKTGLFDVIPDQSFKDISEFNQEFEKYFSNGDTTLPKM